MSAPLVVLPVTPCIEQAAARGRGRPKLSYRHQIELFVVKLSIRLHGDLAPQRLLQVFEDRSLFVPEHPRDIRIDPQLEALAIQIAADLPDFGQDLVTDRGARLDHRGSGAIGARIGQHAFKALLHALPGDDHEAKVRHLECL